jgi:hypothetical protein
MGNIKRLVGLSFIVLWSTGARAEFAPPTLAPINRLLPNAEAYVKENPKHAHGYYVLARIHYLAFSNQTPLVPSFDPDATPPDVAPDWLTGKVDHMARSRRAVELALTKLGYSRASDVPKDKRSEFYETVRRTYEDLERSGWRPEALSAAASIEHATAAALNFRNALAFDPENALYHLGRASLAEQFAGFVRDSTGVETPKEFAEFTPGNIRKAYYRAYGLSIRKNLKLKEQPIAGLASLVGYEAGRAYVRLSEDADSLTEEEQEKLKEVKNNLERLEKLPFGAITPIIFSFQENAGLADLVAPGSRVSFDLDGDGVDRLWPWVKPTTGFLVWDPDGIGRISSGRQLFGSVSWWLFFADGYHALDALDDNRDGCLTGPELIGISVWFDRNSNGRSDPGEVIPVQDVQVAAIAVKSTGHDSGSPMNPAGILLANGRRLPTYDWVTEPFDPHTSSAETGQRTTP